MKNSKRVVIILLTLVSSVSVARSKRKKQEKPSPPYKYYFTMPAEASLADWAYTIPTCQSVSKAEYKFVDRTDNCKEDAESKTKSCLSRADVELKNLKTNERKTFGLNYVIYDTMKACEDAYAKLVPPETAETSAKAEPEKKE